MIVEECSTDDLFRGRKVASGNAGPTLNRYNEEIRHRELIEVLRAIAGELRSVKATISNASRGASIPVMPEPFPWVERK